MFGGRVQALRKDLDLSQVEFAEALGFNSGAWSSDLERGVNGIDVYVLWQICRKWKYPAEYFLNPAWDVSKADVPRTRLDWERLFNGDKPRATVHFEMEQMIYEPHK